jgi:basic amino acid/polyamine antiporter, APA family
MVATASVLLTTIIGISRIIFAMGRTKDLPAFLSRLHPRYRTPQYAIAITGTAIIATLLFVDFTLVVSVGTFAMLVYYGIANVAALRLSPGLKKYPPVVAGLGLASCILLMIFLSPVSIAIGLAALIAGTVYYLFRVRPNSPMPS